MDLATVLQNAQHPNLDIRTQAETYLNQAVEAQYGQFLLALCVELATEGKPDSSRQLAGLYIKNLITASDEALLEQKQNRWFQCEPTVKDQIRACFLQAIRSHTLVVAHTAAQVVAAYGAVDMPLNAWPSLLTALFHYISDPEVHAFSKVASLEALGYMCDTMDPEKVESSVVYQILTSIVDGMRADRHNDIRYAAVKALNNSLCFTETIFSMKAERDAILQAVCEATQSTDVKIRTCAFECFASIADLYYSKLETYIEAIFTLTLTAIRTDEPAVGMQAIEFWSIICEHECSLLEDIEDGNAQPNELFRFAQVAAGPLVPLLLECMTKQDDDFEDNDVWDIATASAKLLESIALTIADSVVDLVVPFISQNINSADWRLKEASLMAFAVILDGPSEARLSPFISQAMSILINCLMDQNILVRDTSAWAIAKICQLHKSSLTSNLLPPLVAALSRILEDPAHRVILQGCFAVHNLSEACSDENEAQSNVLSHFMPQLLQKLLAITQRTDFENESEIRITAYEAINLMVANSALDMHPMIVHLLTETLGRLELSFNPQLDAQERNHLQSHLSSLIGEIVKKLDQATIAPFCDRVMMMLLKVFELKGSIAHEDAMLAMGHIAEKMEGGFIRYAQHVQAPLLTGLKSIDEAQLVTISVGFVGDLCRSLGAAVKPFCDEIVGCLLQLLQAQKVNRSAKPHVIAVFSDIAMAIEGDFDRYAVVVLNILKQAGEINISGDDEDLIDYINTLRHSILDTYTGILHGLKAADKQEVVAPYIDTIMDLLRRIDDKNKSSEVLKTAVGVLGDLGQTFGKRMHNLYLQPFVSSLVQQALTDEEDDVKQVADWSQSMIDAVLQRRG